MSNAQPKNPSRQQVRFATLTAARTQVNQRFAVGEYSSNVPRRNRRRIASRLGKQSFQQIRQAQ